MAKAKPETAAEPPPIQPPGRLRAPGHGLQTGPLQIKTGIARLYEVMHLSTNVPLEKLCEDAAAQIEALQDRVSAETLWPAGAGRARP